MRVALSPSCRLVAIAAVAIGALLGGPSPPLLALADDATPPASRTAEGFDARAAATWVFDQQNPDGGFPGPTGASDPETTIDAVLAAHAWGLRILPSQVLDRARDYLVAHGPAYAARGSGQAARLALAAIALGESPGAFGGNDPVYCDNESGVGGLNLFALLTVPGETPFAELLPDFTGGDVRDQAFVLLAIAAMYGTIPDAALEPLRAAQAPNGGWARGGSGDPDAADAITTALVVQALATISLSEESSDPDIDLRGIEFLRSLQVPGSGYAYDRSQPMVADVASTAAVIQAVLAVYEDPASPEWGNAPQAPAAFQTPSGGFRSLLSDTDPNLAATLQAIPAMVEKPLPIAYECFDGIAMTALRLLSRDPSCKFVTMTRGETG